LVPNDVTPRFVEWVNSAEVRAGLNLPPLDLNELRLRELIARFDGRRNYLLGIFNKGLLIGFYTMDVDTTHKVGTITACHDASKAAGNRVYWSTIDAVLDHFFTYRDIDKIVARVLSDNRAMLFNFIDNSRFLYEARLLQECLAPDGQRRDILIFSAFRDGPRPPGQGMPS